MTGDENAVRQVVTDWMDATKAGNIETVLDLMTDDVIFIVPGAKPFGKAEFAAGSSAMSEVQMDGTSDIQEVQVCGDWAYLRNYLDVTFTSKGKRSRHAGYTLTILRKGSDGKWRVTRDANFVAPVE